MNQSGLLSIKPKIFICNVDEQSIQNGNEYTKNFETAFGNDFGIDDKLTGRQYSIELNIDMQLQYLVDREDLPGSFL